MGLPYGQTVTLVHRTVTGQDARHNDVYTETNEVIEGCAIGAGSSTENVEGTETVSYDVVVMFPPGTVVQAVYRMILPGGDSYEVQGGPIKATSPFTGINSWVEVHGRRVTGSTV